MALLSFGAITQHSARGILVTERTLVLIKPDGVQRLLVGRIRSEERRVGKECRL